MHLEVVLVFVKGFDADILHPSLHTTHQAGTLVAGEIDTAVGLEVG
jgi:hypothetical protein